MCQRDPVDVALYAGATAMTQQHTAAMRFVQGTSAPAPLADPLTEEEAVLVSDTQAAIQRLRDAVVATVGLHPLWTTCVLRSDLATLLDALDAAGPLLAAGERYAQATLEADRLWKVRQGGDDGYLHASQDALTAEMALRRAALAAAQQPPAASPATRGAEGGE